jgi:hypothetical protein
MPYIGSVRAHSRYCSSVSLGVRVDTDNNIAASFLLNRPIRDLVWSLFDSNMV